MYLLKVTLKRSLTMKESTLNQFLKLHTAGTFQGHIGAMGTFSEPGEH